MSLLYLTQQGSKLQKDHGRFVLSFPDRDTVDIPDSVPYRRIIQLQIRRYKKSLLEDAP